MTHFTSFTYQLKRDILSFSNKISKRLSKPDRKFFADMLYGILASGSCLLTDISDKLLEPSKKINTVDRLSGHLAKGTPKEALITYLALLKKWCPAHPVIHIDNSDVVKPDGYKFEGLGWIRDGSKSTSTKNVYQKGYHVTEATELRSRRKGKVKLPLFYKGKMHEAYISHVKVQITASRKDVYLVLVYGITEHPMMLVTNKDVRSKDDVIKTAMLYFSRWKIEEYFRCKKQVFQFENFRVRKLTAINAFLVHGISGSHVHEARNKRIKDRNHTNRKFNKGKSGICYYQLAKGISGILSYAKEGIRLWFRTKRPAYRQLRLKLAV